MGAFSRPPECMEGEFCEGSHAEDATKPWSEHFPTEVGVETLVKDVRVKGECLIVGEGDLHAAHDGVQPLGLGPPVLLVHEVGVVDYLGDLMEHPVLVGFPLLVVLRPHALVAHPYLPHDLARGWVAPEVACVDAV